MPQLENSRFAYVGKLHLELFDLRKTGENEERLPFQSAVFSLRRFCELWNEVSESCDSRKLATAEIRQGRSAGRRISCSTVRIDPDGRHVVFLFDAVDPSASSVAYRNLETNDLRIDRKRDGEGADFSAHLVAELDSETGVYNALLEEAPYASPSSINRIFVKMASLVLKNRRDVLRRPSPTGERDELGQLKMDPFRVRLMFHASPRESFLHDLQDGKSILSMHLVDDSPAHDENAPALIRQKSYKLEPSGFGFFSHFLEGMDDILRYGRTLSCQRLKMQIRTREKRVRTVWFSTTDEENDLLNKSFSEMIEIENLQNSLATGTDRISEELVARMKESFR